MGVLSYIKMALAASLVASATPALAGHEVINRTDKVAERTKSYIVTYPNGFTEQVVARYDGLVAKRVWQTGSSFTYDHPKDDRKCHWNTSVSVRRQLMFISRSGIQAPYGVYEKKFEVIAKGSRGATNFLSSLTYHRTCGDSEGSYSSALAAADGVLISRFDGIVTQDSAQELENIKQSLKAVSVVAAQPLVKTAKAAASSAKVASITSELASPSWTTKLMAWWTN